MWLGSQWICPAFLSAGTHRWALGLPGESRTCPTGVGETPAHLGPPATDLSCVLLSAFPWHPEGLPWFSHAAGLPGPKASCRARPPGLCFLFNRKKTVFLMI